MSKDLRELEADLYRHRETSAIEAVEAYVSAKTDELSTRLHTCDLDAVRGIQGELRAYRALALAINKPPFEI